MLEGTAKFEVVAHCPDGEAALDRMRELRPDVAVVDLNLPKLHAIELVRRVRSEELGTKVVILAGTDDDDIIREVVRAGGDAYLLKNGPARHLIDAISYVRDGGQYFSPQLKRDGLTGVCWRKSRARRAAERLPIDSAAETKRQRTHRRNAARPGNRAMAGHDGQVDARGIEAPARTPPRGASRRKSGRAGLRDSRHDGRRDQADPGPAG